MMGRGLRNGIVDCHSVLLVAYTHKIETLTR